MTISITPINDQMGASITGITGAEAATPEVARQLQGALDEYGVVVLPELNISDDDLAALARLLGEVVLPPYGALADHPEISPVTRDPELDKLARYREANVNWHIDGTTSDAPDKMTLLTARRTAENGEGNTEFANTYAAYRALPDDDKALIDGLRVPIFGRQRLPQSRSESVREGGGPMGDGAEERAPARVEAPGRAAIPRDGLHRRGRDRHARRRGAGLAPTLARLGDAARVHLVAFVARGRPRDLRQHRPAPPSHAVLGDVATVDAPGDDRRRRSLRLTPRIAAVQARTIGMLSRTMSRRSSPAAFTAKRR